MALKDAEYKAFGPKDHTVQGFWAILGLTDNDVGNKRAHTHTHTYIYLYIERVGEFDMRKTTWVSKVQHKVQGMYSNH